MSAMLPDNLFAAGFPWLLAIGWPLAIATCLLIGIAGRWLQLLACCAALPALGLAVGAPVDCHVDLPWLLLGARFGLDEIARVFLLFTAVLWLAAGVYGGAYFAGDPKRRGVWVFFLAAMSGNFGLVLSLDMVSFYCFYALMGLASYGLIVHSRDRSALRAGRVYLTMAIIGEVLVFSGMAFTARTRGSLLFEDGTFNAAQTPQGMLMMALILAGFGIKAGAVPLHMWLPLAHPAAPTPASAVLSGAMIKAGLLGWLRFLPLGELALPQWGALCIAVGLTAAFYGVLVGVTQTNAKTLLAYSSISQMGLLVIGVGIGLSAPQWWELASAAVLLYALHHALAKGALFLGVAVMPEGPALRWQRGLTLTALAIPALALAGAPMTSGAIAKTALKKAAQVAPDTWSQILLLCLPVAAVGTTLLMVRFFYLVWPRGSRARAVDRGLLLPWLALVAASGSLIWFMPASLTAKPIGETLTLGKSWLALWPVLSGVALGIIVGSAVRVGRLGRSPVVPAGDILVLLTLSGQSLRAIPRAARRSLLSVSALLSRGVLRLRDLAGPLARRRPFAFGFERWSTATALMLILALTLAMALLW